MDGESEGMRLGRLQKIVGIGALGVHLTVAGGMAEPAGIRIVPLGGSPAFERTLRQLDTEEGRFSLDWSQDSPEQADRIVIFLDDNADTRHIPAPLMQLYSDMIAPPQSLPMINLSSFEELYGKPRVFVDFFMRDQMVARLQTDGMFGPIDGDLIDCIFAVYIAQGILRVQGWHSAQETPEWPFGARVAYCRPALSG